MNMPGFKNALNRYIFTIIFYSVILLRKVDLRIYFQTSEPGPCIIDFFLPIMNYIYVFLQISLLRKCLSTNLTPMILLSIMNFIDVFLQVSCFWKCLSTNVTFVIFFIIMNWIDVVLQYPWLRKCLSTRGQCILSG